jgi:hypothetical protein
MVLDEKPNDENYMSFDDSDVVGYSTAATAVLNDPISK